MNTRTGTEADSGRKRRMERGKKNKRERRRCILLCICDSQRKPQVLRGKEKQVPDP